MENLFCPGPSCAGTQLVDCAVAVRAAVNRRSVKIASRVQDQPGIRVCSITPFTETVQELEPQTASGLWRQFECAAVPIGSTRVSGPIKIPRGIHDQSIRGSTSISAAKAVNHSLHLGGRRQRCHDESDSKNGCGKNSRMSAGHLSFLRSRAARYFTLAGQQAYSGRWSCQDAGFCIVRSPESRFLRTARGTANMQDSSLLTTSSRQRRLQASPHDVLAPRWDAQEDSAQ